MKYSIIIIFVFSLTACGPDSSPEKRMNTKTDSIQRQLDTVKQQNAALLDSLKKIRIDLEAKK